MQKKTGKVICVVCPRSCIGIIEYDENEIFSIEGYLCARGKKYGTDEVTLPKRMLTTTVRIKDAILPLLPVVSSLALPKYLVLDCAKFLSNVTVQAPVKTGDVIVKNILDSGIDIIASRDME